MPKSVLPLRAAVVIDRPGALIVDALARFDVHARTAHVLGYTLTGSRPDLRADTEVPVRLVEGDRLRFRRGSRVLQVQVDRTPPGGAPELTVVGTAQLPGWLAGARVRFDLADTGAGTVVTAEFLARSRLPVLTALHRGRVLTVLRHLLGIVTLAVHEDQVVVAAAIVRDGRVLAARRTHPRREAGKWELPGGKVEPGETPQDALVREIAEELGVDIRVIRRIGPAVPLAVELVLHTYLAELISGDPEPAEHDRIAWLAAAELDGVHWLPADVELLPDLAELLAPEGSDRPQV